MKITFRKFISWFLMVSLIAAPFTAQAADYTDLINQKKQELKDLQSKIDQQEQQLSAKTKEKLSLANQIAILNDQIQATQLQLRRIATQSDELNLQHQQLNKQLVDAEEQIMNNKLVLREALQVSYQEKRLGMLEILFTSTTFSDFMTRLEYIQTVEEHVTDLIKQLNNLMSQLKDRKSQVEEITAQLQDLQAQKELEQNNLSVQQAAKANILQVTKNQESQYASQLEASKQEMLAVSSEISRLMSGQKRSAVGPKSLAWPIASRTITATFNDPDYYRIFGIPHTGLDIATPQGTPVKAPADGTVTQIHDGGATGVSYMTITHDNGLATAYLHLSAFAVSVGTYVVQGQVIGYSGGTPGTHGAGYLTTGPHLHFEVWDGGQRQNPLNYLV